MNCLTVMLKKHPKKIPSAKLYSSSALNGLIIGHVLKLSRTFTDSDVTDYKKLTLDTNPLHFDTQCAKNAGFIDRLVPGILVASLFPKVIASHFPGAVYVAQTLQFKFPVYIGEEINAEIHVITIREMKNKYLAKFSTSCFKDGNVIVIDGEATAILPTLKMEGQ